MDERTLHLRPPPWLPIGIALILSGAFMTGKAIETRSDPALISVTGEGKVTAIPDIASLSFGVQTGRRPTAQAAMEKLSADMNAVMEAVKAAGIEEKDITTSSLQLFPAYDWNEGAQIPRGFEANQSLRVKVRDLGKIGTILTAATKAGANQIGGVSFTIDDPEGLHHQARGEAIAKAREKAQGLAADLGVALGKLKGFNEGGGYPIPMMERAMMMDEGKGGGGEPIPVPPGEQEIRVAVTLTYEVK